MIDPIFGRNFDHLRIESGAPEDAEVAGIYESGDPEWSGNYLIADWFLGSTEFKAREAFDWDDEREPRIVTIAKKVGSWLLGSNTEKVNSRKAVVGKKIGEFVVSDPVDDLDDISYPYWEM